MGITAAQGVQGQAEWLPAGIQVVLHHLGEAPESWSPPSHIPLLHSSSPLPTAPVTNLSPPDELVTLVPIGFIDLHERVRLAKQILGMQKKGSVSAVRSAEGGG